MPTNGAEQSDPSTWVELNGVRHRYLRYGEETIDRQPVFATPCHICLCLPGEVHAEGCPLGAGGLHQRPATCPHRVAAPAAGWTCRLHARPAMRYVWTHRNSNQPGALRQQIDFMFASKALTAELTGYHGGVESFPDAWDMSDHAPLVCEFTSVAGRQPSRPELDTPVRRRFGRFLRATKK